MNKRGRKILLGLTVVLVWGILSELALAGQSNDGRNGFPDEFVIGADLSVLKKIEDSGGIYKQDNIPRDALIIFKNHGFNWIRLRLFHTPSGEGPVCNDLPYTTALIHGDYNWVDGSTTW